METIAINTGDPVNEKENSKKKAKNGNSAKTAVAAGVAGIAGVALGVGADTVIDTEEATTNTAENSYIAANRENNDVQEEVLSEVESTEINPDDVMIEESWDDHSSEDEVLAEMHLVDDEFQPFANNDDIGQDLVPEVQQEDVLLAENTESDIIIGEDSTVDLICDSSNASSSMELDQMLADTEQNSDVDFSNEITDIQSDLMV